MRTLVILLLGVVAVSALPKQSSRIVGGTVTTIQQYPHLASLLYSATNSGHRQTCVGSILNNRSILTAAHCIHGDGVNRWRTRIGSANANSGGTVKNTHSMRFYPSYNIHTRDHDVGIIRVSSTIRFSNTIRAGYFAGANYHVPDNQIVWAAGWGYISEFGPASEQLRHVQKWTINLITCRQRYMNIGRLVTDNMLCSGWLDVGGRDHCHGDNGAPLMHNGVVVGVRSWGEGCGRPNFPGVSARVQRYTNWILQHQ